MSKELTRLRGLSLLARSRTWELVRLQVGGRAAQAPSSYSGREHARIRTRDAHGAPVVVGSPASCGRAIYSLAMATSDKDRSYLARLGAFKQASHEEIASEHQALSLAERLARSWALFEAFADSTKAPRDDSGPLAFYERARSLGLLRR